MAKHKEPSRTEKWGAQYLNAKMGIQIVSPASDAAIGALEGGGVGTLKADLAYRYTKGGIASTLESAAVAVLQRWGDKKIGQAGALSRNSLTAIGSELVPLVQVYADGPKTIRGLNDSFVRHTDGYSPNASQLTLSDAKTYVFAKYGLGLGRKVVNQSKMLDPAKKFLGDLGASL